MDRTIIFLFTLKLWTYFFRYCLKILDFFLYTLIKFLPDSGIIYDGRHLVNWFNPNKQRENVNIIDARDHNNNTITNKLKLFLNFNWDKSACDELGGINIEKFCEWVGSSMIWIAYVLEYEKIKVNLDNLTNNEIHISPEMHRIKDNIKGMLINIDENLQTIVSKYHYFTDTLDTIINEEEKNEEEEYDIDFGDISFY